MLVMTAAATIVLVLLRLQVKPKIFFIYLERVCAHDNVKTASKKSFMEGKSVFLTIIALMAMNSQALGATVTFVDPNPSASSFSDCTPGCTPQFQQLYSASRFSGPGYITALSFEYLVGDSSLYNLSLSTSPRSVSSGGLSPVFADNIGPDSQLFYSGPWIIPELSTHQATFAGTPFYYDPNVGDLLLNITHSSISSSKSSYIFMGSLVDRNYSFLPIGDGFSKQFIGLETTFTISPFASGVPEPATWAMMIVGFGTVGGALRRRRQGQAQTLAA